VHAASAARQPGFEFVGVWGRNAERAAALADEFHIRAFTDVEELIDNVEALTFAVPPDVQAEIALRAVRDGRHVLLEKPVAISAAAARELEAEVASSNTASIVFFTQRFVPSTQAWLEETLSAGGWVSGRVEMHSNIYVPVGPFSLSQWRVEHGALWDIGPHALSLLWPVVGEVTAVVAGRGVADRVELILRHSAGQSSSVSLSLTAPPAAIGRAVYFDGEQGRASLPTVDGTDVVRAHGAALEALMHQAQQAHPAHPCDVHFGTRVVEVLSAAEQSLADGCWVSM
jgi:predicted dehydrogenase